MKAVLAGSTRATATGAAARLLLPPLVGSLLLLGHCSSFQIRAPLAPAAGTRRGRRSGGGVSVSASLADHPPPSDVEEPSTDAEAPAPAPLDPEAIRLKDDLVALAAATQRGFSASRADRTKAKELIRSLATYSPSDEPAAAYYADGASDPDSAAGTSSLAGKWTLIYTDAPDITSLDAGGPLAAAKLGRIGQECDPPSIKNVIEWRRPEWASNLPFGGGGGGESDRVLQKVCCEGTATPEKPNEVDLKILGLEVSGVSGVEEGAQASGGGMGLDALLGGPAAWFERNPVQLQGPLTAPFGKFEILYLDDDMRITETYQGYFAVNVREESEWF